MRWALATWHLLKQHNLAFRVGFCSSGKSPNPDISNFIFKALFTTPVNIIALE